MAALADEADMPLEQLLAMYGMVVDADRPQGANSAAAGSAQEPLESGRGRSRKRRKLATGMPSPLCRHLGHACSLVAAQTTHKTIKWSCQCRKLACLHHCWLRVPHRTLILAQGREKFYSSPPQDVQELWVGNCGQQLDCSHPPPSHTPSGWGEGPG